MARRSQTTTVAITKVAEVMPTQRIRVGEQSDQRTSNCRIERHRMVNSVLAADLAGGVHALAIHADAPGESGRSKTP